MTDCVALLRAVDIGGTGKLPMNELKAKCEGLGFTDVRTGIANGHVLFTSKLGESATRRILRLQLKDCLPAMARMALAENCGQVNPACV